MDAVQVVESWHDFYLSLAQAAATLVGLLFIAVSLNIDVVTDKNTNLRVMATGMLTSFVFLLIFAFQFLVPNQGTSIGTSLIITAAFGLLNTLPLEITAWRSTASKAAPSTDAAYTARQIFWRFIVPTIGYAAIVVISIIVLNGNFDGLYWLVGIFITLLITALVTTWELMIAVGRSKREGNTTKL